MEAICEVLDCQRGE
ncbi:hypothetical protein [Priestia aryabhattai]